MASFFRTLPDLIQQPFALAMLGSLGAHFLLFATLPAFTSSTEPRPEAEVRRVQFVEPPQGSAAPQATRSQIGLPPVPNTPNSKIQLPPAGSGTSPVPNPLYTLPNLDTQPFLPPPPQLSQERIEELRRLYAQRLQQTQQQPKIKIPKTPIPTPPQQPNPPLPDVKQDDPSKVARGIQPTPTTQPSTAPVAPLTPQTREQKILASTRYNPEGTTQQDSLQATQKLAQALAAQGLPWEYIRDRQPQEPLKERPYPLPFALNNYKQNPIAVVVFVGKDGKPLPNTSPKLIGSTGYPILNDKAIEIIQAESNQPNKYPAIAEDKIRVYVYEFQFKSPSTGTS